ncbi:hypothetical protein SAMN05421688_3434 [Poseidonocella pacifica]|uniref:Uncharacterized protein n=1 Tax=Poseidonocella pacifica TaxID=871651 RepID=A0A1I0Z0G2_9RHOB|nr:hypothetical protein SAMN05421688_3434 [Poseidonocella pacifica]
MGKAVGMILHYPRSTQDVLSVPGDLVPELVRSMTADRSFSRLVNEINEELLGGDKLARQKARDALSHLGFVD